MCHIYNMVAGANDEPSLRRAVNTLFKQVDGYLDTELQARALSLALSWGWIDRLATTPDSITGLASLAGIAPAAARLPVSLLVSSSVLAAGEPIALTPSFRALLAHRDLIEARLWFALLAGGDVHDHFELLLRDVSGFMSRAGVFELFRYDRCLTVSEENLALSRRWVSYTSTLTRHEADACWQRVPLEGTRRLLDLGGNSGEFAWQACRRAAELKATVLDLPVVCTLGREHLAGRPGGERVSFHAADMRSGSFPKGHDLISFKSVLHDWPDEEAAGFISAASEALAPGGRLVIFERGEMPLDGRRLGFASVANLVFLPFFRQAGFYHDRLAEGGLSLSRSESIEIDMPFHLIVAEKRA
jgi:SAM-dependent methyltransferase